MRNIHDPNEYHKYKSTNGGSNNRGGLGKGFGCGGWIVIAIVVFFLISFIADGASWEAIESLLAFGFIAFLLVRWLFG